MSKRARLEAVLAATAMGTIVVITMANVVVRYFTNQSFAWTEEVSVFLLLVVTLAGSAVAAAGDRHIRVGYIYETGSVARQALLARISAAACLVLFLGMTVLLGRVGYDEFVHAETSMALGLPRWWYTGLITALSAAITLRVTSAAIRLARDAATARARDAGR